MSRPSGDQSGAASIVLKETCSPCRGKPHALASSARNAIQTVRRIRGDRSPRAARVETGAFAAAGSAKHTGDVEIPDVFRAWFLTHMRRIVGAAGGAAKPPEHAGDGFLATFDGPARAITCAHAIAETVRDLGLEVRSGVHTGECELVGDKVGGIAVHIGARVAATATAGEVLVSSTVRDLVAGSGIEFEERGEHVLKGVPGAWRLYAVKLGSSQDPRKTGFPRR